MAVAVFSRVGARLKFAHMDLDALRLELARRYSMQVDPRALAALAADERIQRPDVEVLVAIAGVLAVPVDALLDVHAAGMPPNGGAADDGTVRDGVSPSPIPDAREREDALLDPAREERLRALTRVRDAERALTEAEARELNELLDAAGRVLVARNIDAYAEAKDISRAQARGAIMAVVNDAAAFAAELERNPDLMAAEVAAAQAARVGREE